MTFQFSKSMLLASLALALVACSAEPEPEIRYSLDEIAAQGEWRAENKVTYIGVPPAQLSDIDRMEVRIAAVEEHCRILAEPNCSDWLSREQARQDAARTLLRQTIEREDAEFQKR